MVALPALAAALTQVLAATAALVAPAVHGVKTDSQGRPGRPVTGATMVVVTAVLQAVAAVLQVTRSTRRRSGGLPITTRCRDRMAGELQTHELRFSVQPHAGPGIHADRQRLDLRLH